MFAKHGLTPRMDRFSESFESKIENEIRKALAEKFRAVRKTQAGDIRVGFDNLDHVDITVTQKSGKDSKKPTTALLEGKETKSDGNLEFK